MKRLNVQNSQVLSVSWYLASIVPMLRPTRYSEKLSVYTCNGGTTLSARFHYFRTFLARLGLCSAWAWGRLEVPNAVGTGTLVIAVVDGSQAIDSLTFRYFQI